MELKVNWSERFVALAEHISGWSKDRSTKIGAVIVGSNREVIAMGYNGFPRCVDDFPEERHERPEKYFWTEHAERNAIYNAARVGTPTQGTTMYTNWYPCSDCARGIIQSGIAAVIVNLVNMDHPKFREDFIRVEVMLREAGVLVQTVKENG